MTVPSTTFISRKQYNLLIERDAEWMATYWAKNYVKQWSLNGVMVMGSAAAIEILRAKISLI